MSTKVKGEVIKESSIPLSALDDECKTFLPYTINNKEPVNIELKVGVTEYRIENLYGFGDYFKLNNQLFSKKQINSFELALSGPSITCKFEYRGVFYLILNISPVIDQTITLYSDVSINKIKELFIPDTVLKTTPQTLSDNDKNQALANLGIADLLEALKPVQLSDAPPVGSVTQEQLDEIGLTEKVINNILNGYTNKIKIYNDTYCVTEITKNETGSTFTFSYFRFHNEGTFSILTQYTYRYESGVINIEFMEV